MTQIYSLDFYALCEIASYLAFEDFKSFVSACRQFSECRHDLRTVACVLVNGSSDVAKALKNACVRKFNAAILRYIIRKMGGRDVVRSLHSVAYERLIAYDILSILNREFNQDQKLDIFECMSEDAGSCHFEMIYKLLGCWSWTRESLLAMQSTISKQLRHPEHHRKSILAILCFSIDRSIPADRMLLLNLFEFHVQYQHFDDAFALIPHLSDEDKNAYIRGRRGGCCYYFCNIEDQTRIISRLEDSLSVPLNDDDRAEALETAAFYGNLALIGRFKEYFDFEDVCADILTAAVEGGQEEVFNRYINDWSDETLSRMTNACLENIYYAGHTAFDQLFEVFMGLEARPKDAPRVKIFASLLAHGLLDMDRIRNKMLELTFEHELGPEFRERLFKRYDIWDFDQEVIERYFIRNMTSASDVKALVGWAFSQNSVDKAFVDLLYYDETKIEVLEAFLLEWKPSEVEFFRGIGDLYIWEYFDILDWLRANRYFFHEIPGRTPISESEFDDLSGPETNPYTLDLVLLYTVHDDKPEDVRIRSLLDRDIIAPSQEIIDEAFRIVVQRELQDCIKAFLTAQRNRPSTNLVRDLIPPDHLLHDLAVEIKFE